MHDGKLKGELRSFAVQIKIECDFIAISDQALEGIENDLLTDEACLELVVLFAGFSLVLLIDIGFDLIQDLILEGIGNLGQTDLRAHGSLGPALWLPGSRIHRFDAVGPVWDQ